MLHAPVMLGRRLLRACGFDVIRYPPPWRNPPSDLSADELAIVNQIAPFTMTSFDRQVTLIQAVRYLVRRGIAGAFVECGVWRGGSSMAIALTLLQEGVTDRDLYLYDTYEGMPPPEAVDTTVDGVPAEMHLARDADRTGWVWAVAGIEDVQRQMAATGYPSARVHYIRGRVQETLPAQMPHEPIALARLDTDWYASTRHELCHLYPKVSRGGMLMIDDYGHWTGARQAVDEYFAADPPFLHRVDYTARLIVKPECPPHVAPV